jgi:hypothetical protein
MLRRHNRWLCSIDRGHWQSESHANGGAAMRRAPQAKSGGIHELPRGRLNFHGDVDRSACADGDVG